MKRYVRFVPAGAASDRGAPPRYGLLDGETVRELGGAPFAGDRPTGAEHALEDVRLLAPCEPSKVLAVGLNFRSHLGGRPLPAEPGLFAKMPTSIIGPGEAIELPPDSREVHFEGELVIVIGRRARSVPPDDAGDHIFGVTAGNDVSERTWQAEDLQWLRAKGSDTFGPLGPAILAGADLSDLLIETRLNGELVQSERSSDQIFPLETVVSFASRYVTLLPGDVIFTGTPGTTSSLAPGDRVAVTVEGAGPLENPVARRRV